MTIPSEIAAAALGQGSGDNSNAGALAALATKPIVNGLTPTDFYSDFVTALGSVVSQVQTENTAQIASVTQLQTTRDSLSSVNLNDRSSAHAAVRAQLPGGFSGVRDSQYRDVVGFEFGCSDCCVLV